MSRPSAAPILTDRRVCSCVSSGCGKAILGSHRGLQASVRGRYVSAKEFKAHKKEDEKLRLLKMHGVDPSSTGVPTNVPTSPVPTSFFDPAHPTSCTSTSEVTHRIPSETIPSTGNDSGRKDRGRHGTSREQKAVSALQKWRETFTEGRCPDMSSQSLRFLRPLSSANDESVDSLELRRDALENMDFLAYESWLLDIFHRVEQVSSGVSESLACDSARRELLDDVETEWSRIVDLKRAAFASQCQQQSDGASAHQLNVDTPGGMPLYEVDTAKYLSSPLQKMQPIIAASYLLVAVLHLLCGLSLEHCGFTLDALRCIVELALSFSGALKPAALSIVRSVPKDARHVLKVLELAPAVKAFVCCPKCFACYPDSGGDSYPNTCTFKSTPSSTVCGRNLKKTRRIHGKTHTLPARTYLYHDMKQWVGEQLCRPGMEDLWDRDITASTDGVWRDIWDAENLHDLRGQDGQPFFSVQTSEGRYAFSIGMDGFNPFGMKEAGKTLSVCAIYMVCLNLPPQERYKVENMFLVGVIPGPSEPSLDQINHLIAPLVDDLLLFYETGIRYTRTPRHPNGRDVRLALVPVVCDLPASRQLIGFASFSSLTFCVFCPLNLREIGNLDCDSWGQRTSEEYRRWAFRWRDAESESIRAKITTEHGVRYSELLRLPYWNPVENTVVDTLHALFLGNFQHHCRVVWGMDVKVEDGDGSTSDPLTSSLMTSLDVQKAFVALRKGSRKDVEALKMTTLRLLVQERGLRVTSRRKHVYVDTLINYRIQQGWFDSDDQLILPPRDDELPQLNTDWKSDELTTSEHNTALAYYETAESSKAFQDLKKPLIAALYASKVQDNTTKFSSLTKADLIQRLMHERVREGIVDASYKLISPDPERFANARRANSERKKSRVLGHARLSEAWSDMERTTLPSWLAAAPAHIGEAKSGKVTADQWRTFCTIHLVVTLVRLWGTKDNNHSQREQDMLHNFMNLVAATKLASMRTMTAQRALAFKDFMLKYLHGLQDIFPGIPLTPNQHNTLHLFDIFRRFGPCHAWRCWAFERWNYLLQHIPTNRHFGELEKTMFERLCMGQRLRHIMNDAIDSVSNALRALADSFNRRFNADKRGTRLNDILAFVEPVQSPAEDLSLHKDTLTRVEVELLRRHLESQATSGLAPDAFRYATRVRHACQRHKKFHHRGASYSPWSSSPGDSYVVIGEDILGAWYAARIQGIFSHTQTPHSETRVVNTYFIIQRFKPLTIDEGSLDPYRAFPIAGGRLYHDTVESTLEFVTMKDILCHFAHTPFASKELGDCVHVLPIDRE